VNADAELQYQRRLRKVIDYVDTHLTEALRIDQLGSVAAFSKFHFHRQFSEFFGINVSKFIQLARLNRATQQLAFRDDAIIEIGLCSGYESAEAFARAFKKVTGQTPTEFRKQPNWYAWFNAYQPVRELRKNHMTTQQLRQVNIVNTEAINVAALEHRGDPTAIGSTVRKFIEWRKQHLLHPNRYATFNILYEDPEIAEPDQYRLDLCVATDVNAGDNPTGVINKTIPGGRCAVLRHIGSDDSLRASISYLYATWLPASDEELRDFPLYVQRVKFFPDVPEHEAIVDIFLPLKQR